MIGRVSWPMVIFSGTVVPSATESRRYPSFLFEVAPNSLSFRMFLRDWIMGVIETSAPPKGIRKMEADLMVDWEG